MNLWITGTYPCPQSYNTWDYSELDPERFRREELILERRRYLIKGRGFSIFACKKASMQKPEQIKKSHCPQSSTTHATCDRKASIKRNTECSHNTKDHHCPVLFSRKATQQVKRISETRACVNFFMKKSHPACKMPEMTSNLFNLYGKSPLIVYFFLNYSNLLQRGQDVLIIRRERTKIVPDSTPTYADVINLTLKNMEKRRRKLGQLSQLHESEWSYFNNYLKELEENFEREVNAINKRDIEKRKANHVFVSPSLLFEEVLDKKSKGNSHRETMFLSRKGKKELEKEEKQKPLQSLPSRQRPLEVYTLDLKSPYRIGSPTRKHISQRSKAIQRREALLRLSPSSSTE